MANVPRDIYARVPISPCKGCEDRAIQCHSSCIRYNEWSAQAKQIKSDIKKMLYKERMVEDYEINARRRMRKSSR